MAVDALHQDEALATYMTNGKDSFFSSCARGRGTEPPFSDENEGCGNSRRCVSSGTEEHQSDETQFSNWSLSGATLNSC